MKKIHNTNSKSKKAAPNKLRIYFLVVTLILAFSAKSFALDNPSTVTCTVLSATQITASWSAVSGAAYYMYEIDTNPVFDGVWDSQNGFTTSPTTTFAFSGLLPGTTYYVHIASASSGWVWSGATTSGDYTTTACISPGTPVNVFCNPTGTTIASASWDAGTPAGSPVITYYWVIGTSSSVVYGSGIKQGTTTTTSVSVTGLTSNTSYYLRVYAKTQCDGTQSSYATSNQFKTFPSNLASISATSTAICNGSTSTLTANGVAGTVYWYSGSCGGTYITTGNSISVSPSSTTSYYARNYNGNYSSSCAMKTITVTSTAVPTGNATQYFCDEGYVANLVANGTGTIKWYDEPNGGTQYNSVDALEDGNYYYASQIKNGCESALRLEVGVSLKPTPTLTLDASSTSIIAGTTTGNLTYSSTTGNPNVYSIEYEDDAINMGFENITNATFSGGIIPLIIPAGAAAITYNAELTVKNATAGCVSQVYPITITVSGFNFSVSQDIGTTLKLTWTALMDANLLSVQYRLHSGGPWIGTPNTTNSVKLNDLLPNTEYDCRLVIYKNGTFWGYSTMGNFTTATANYEAVNNIGTTLQLNWSNFPWATSYIIQYRKVGNPNWIGAPSITSNFLKLTNLEVGQNYECQVRVYKNNLLWGICQLGTFHTETVDFSTSLDIGTTLLMNWTPIPWATNFVIRYRSASGAWTGVSSTSSHAKLSNLMPDTDYEYQVRIYKNTSLWGCSAISTIHTNKIDFTTVQDNGTSMDIAWTTPGPWVTSYTLQYRLPSSTTWIGTTSTTLNNGTITPIIVGQDYFVRVKVSTAGSLWGTSKEQKIGRISPSGKSFTMSSNNNSDGSLELNVYPNPFVEQINLEITATQETPCNWTIYDITGKQVMSGSQAISIGNNTLNIDASQLTNGIYMLTTIINTEKHDFRILKQ